MEVSGQVHNLASLALAEEPLVLMAWYLVKYGDNFTVTCTIPSVLNDRVHP
jgi:hypothetical protein